ncbi:MAG TPA: ABC transporter substrate-binding protein [Acidimicrobiia bacterium]|nr:ABC transporter substrate-binding protein [Acidimicrobiia bacterium]
MTQRRTAWRSVLVSAVALMLFAAACSSGSSGDGGANSGNGGGGGFRSGEPQQGGTLRYGVEAETSGLNPTTDRFAAAGYLMGNAVFDRIAYLDENGEYSPYLAESITPNDDLTEWTVVLRSGVKFHDGTLLTSEALKLTLELAIADPLVGLAIKPLFRAENPVEIVDELTARYYMAEPNAHFPLYSTSQVGFIASPTWLRAAAENPDLNQEPVGTGPFIFKSRSQDSSTTFERNPDWWNGDVYLDEIEFVVQTDAARRYDQLVAGELDVMHTSDPAVIKLVRNDSDLTSVEDDTGEEGFVMINTEATPFDDLRVRQALAFATPKKDYLELITQGVTDPADSMFHPDLKWNNPKVKQEADQPEKAKELAEEYCAENPQNCEGDKIKMQFKYTGPSVQQDLIADTLINGWQDAFVIERDQVLQDDYITQVALGDYQVVTWRQYGTADPEGEFVWHDCRSISPVLSINWTRNCNEETQQLLEDQRSSSDEAERIDTWQQISQNIHDDYIYIFLNHTDWMIAAQPYVGGGLDSDFPEGGLKTAASNGSHSVSQMWLDK